ncbi:MAG TPA: FtsQ-type POTRA domain-containing protein [Chondromyces sp.]|nr:FtsQ-type POTRA domain-containing protein [Chondromyces sp.]
MNKGKIVSIEERIPKLKNQRKKKANRRLILLLSIFFLLLLAIVYFQSPLSAVRNIEVQGNNMISKETLIEWSEIQEGTNVWKINRKETASKLEKKPGIKEATLHISFPNNVRLVIEEQARLAYLANGTGYFPVLEDGKIIEKPVNVVPANAPILYKFDENVALEKLMASLEKLPKEIVNSISEIHYSPKKTDRLHITLYMNDGFEVTATLRTFADKMVYYPSIVSQLDPNVKGVIDLEVGSYFRAYEVEGDQKNEENTDGR